ncbi:hypothetical protein JX265_007027 [Neoarthrinium moseri]|uniref:ATPase AAA-type core domain-containing protein n=1 Tax=Neoarthrinium moseri TaxID=1658444 RepID=A0A9P9WKB0_9PEZI|nr:hypothetical protein JX265_007027 [Neoarthrinium moseri]
MSPIRIRRISESSSSDGVQNRRPNVEVPTDSDTDSSSEDRESSDKREPIKVGMTAETKNLYREDFRVPWRLWAPGDVRLNSASTASSAKFALIVRREKANGDADATVLVLHSITVQSPLIRKQLGPVFTGYQGFNTNLKKLEFRAPFREFFYRWDEFCKVATIQEDGEDGERHYRLLFNIISSEIEPHIDQAEDLLKNHVISFDYVWAMFEPGAEVIARMETMTAYTCYLRPGIDDIRVRLEQRGRKFEMLRGLPCMAYSGAYQLQRTTFGAPHQQYVEEGRIMIDCASFLRYNGRRTEDLGPLDRPSAPSDHMDTLGALTLGDDLDDEPDHGPGGTIRLMRYMAKKARRIYAGRHQKPSSTRCLLPEYYALCCATVRGFCLKAKEWATFSIDMVKDIQWSHEAFNQLVLPEDYKKIIWAFVDTQLSGSDDFDDIVRGKGRGVVMLLSGEPGTVADAMKKPLYNVSAGELGDSADAVEANLRRVLELSTKWSAVLLIDECDVFLEKRTISDLHRNKLVSVFLRLLEYYQGVMFLTTNRVASFDPAFESRIHLTIDYPRLDFADRLHIWRTFVSSSSAVVEEELEGLSRIELNGRQIKNVVKTARLLAARERGPLALEHIETVLRVKKILPKKDET